MTTKSVLVRNYIYAIIRCKYSQIIYIKVSNIQKSDVIFVTFNEIDLYVGSIPLVLFVKV